MSKYTAAKVGKTVKKKRSKKKEVYRKAKGISEQITRTQCGRSRENIKGE